MITRTNLLKVAQGHLGEGGARFRKFAGLPSGTAYCNAFVDFVASEGGVSKLYFNGKKETYCPHSIKWCNANLAQVPLYLALPMDIIYFDWDKNGVPNHIGFVRGRKSTSEIYTIEGNTNGGIVAQKTRSAKYVQAVYRTHFDPAQFSPKKALKKAKLDEANTEFGYVSIYNLQLALGMKATGILTKETVKYLQRKVGATPDGAWGKATSKLIQQKLCGFKGKAIDGAFGAKSICALKKWVNKANYPAQKKSASKAKSAPSTAKPAPKPAPKPATPKPAQKVVRTKPELAVEWAREIAKSKAYTYKKWNNKDKKTKLCPVCHPSLKGKYKGWNCIGFVSACWFHGAGLKKIQCSCAGIGTNNFFTKVSLNSWRKRNGNDWTMISVGAKGGADIPASKLKLGDILVCYDGNGKFHHAVLYTGNSKYIDCTNTSKNHIAERAYSNLCKKYHVTRAFRYTGK